MAVGVVLIATGVFVLLVNTQYKIDQQDPEWRQ